MKIQNYKNDFTYSYTLGITLTIELLLKKPDKCMNVYFHSSFFQGDSYNKIRNLCEKYNIEIINSDKVFNIVSQKENCYVIGVFSKYTCKLNEGSHVVLVNPSNAGNLGTIIRSCVGFGINNLGIIRNAVDIFDPKAVRASMGSLFSINFKYYDSFNDYQKEFPNNIPYPFMLKGKNNLSETSFIKPCTLVFGNEATGLPDSFLEFPNSVLINHSHNIDSLNLPIALSVACYEFTKNDWKK